jgi:hypothetical protein
MTRFARRVDANHSEIVEAYERLGVAVVDLSRVAELTKPGLPDLLCSLHGHTFLSETKTDAGKLSDAQLHFAELWKGQIHVVRTVDDVIAVVKEVRRRSRIFGSGVQVQGRTLWAT